MDRPLGDRAQERRAVGQAHRRHVVGVGARAGGQDARGRAAPHPEDPGVVEMEVAAVTRISRVDPELPVPVARPALDGKPIVAVEVRGTAHLVRLLPLLPGRNPRPDELDERAVRELGVVVLLARAGGLDAVGVTNAGREIGIGVARRVGGERADPHPHAGRAPAMTRRRAPSAWSTTTEMFSPPAWWRSAMPTGW